MTTLHDPSKIPYVEHFSMTNLRQIFHKIAEDGWLKGVIAVCATGVHWIFDSRTEALVTITALIFLDTLTGALKAWKAKKLSSGGFFRFALKCVVYFILMATAALVDKVMPIPFASIIMVTFLAATEAISIMENLGAAGYAVPTALLKRLRALRDAGGQGVEPAPAPVEKVEEKK